MDLTQGWSVAKLHELATFLSGALPRRHDRALWGGELPWLAPGDMEGGADTGEHTWRTLSAAGAAQARIAPAGSVLLLAKGRRLLARVPVRAANQDLAFHPDIKALLPGQRIGASYLLHCLAANQEALLRLVRVGSGGVPSLHIPTLRQLPVRFPSMAEQGRIADALACWDTAIGKARKTLERMEKRQEGVVCEMYRRHENTRRTAQLKSFLTPSTEVAGEGTDVLAFGPDGRLRREAKPQGGKNVRYFARWPGQFIYSRRDYHAFAVIPQEFGGLGSAAELAAFDIAPHVNPDWLLHFVGRREFKSRQSGLALARGHAKRLHPSDLLGIKILLPSRAEQDLIAEAMQACREEQAQAVSDLELLMAQKDQLMQHLLSGKICLPPTTGRCWQGGAGDD